MKESLNVTIDRDDCISCAACWGLCPEVFEENEDDFSSQVVPQLRSGDDLGKGSVPQELGDCVREAAESCPVEIIHLE